MRKYIYLITEDPRRQDMVGLLEITDNLKTPSSKNEETAHRMADWSGEGAPTDDDRWTRRLVSVGHADFEDEDDYADRIESVVRGKLDEIDDRHIEKAGIAEEVSD